MSAYFAKSWRKQLRCELNKKTEEVKTQCEILRAEIKVRLEKYLPKISENCIAIDVEKLKLQKRSAIRTINKTIAKKYKQVIADVSQF